MSKDGLVIVYTGNGKGKTTAALGLAMRAIGYEHKVCMLQFIKGSWHYGEMDSSKKLEPNFELIAIGKGFVGILDDNSPREEHEKYAAEALRICREKINSGNYNVVILDEVNYAINLGLIDVQEIIKLIKEKNELSDYHTYKNATHCWDCEAMHGFTKKVGNGNIVTYLYNEKATSDSKKRVLTFFDKIISTIE